MAMQRCEHGHFYDPDKSSTCPSCGVPGLNVETLIKDVASERYDTEVPTQAHGGGQGARGSAGHKDPGATVGLYEKKLGIDPVVGWLVCVSGPDKGRDYRIKSERNFMGRDPSMDIHISGDDGISRVKHAVISYNPRKHTFLLAPGESSGIVYHNGDEVISPVELAPYDEIEMATTKLRFIPFCGPGFNWEG